MLSRPTSTVDERVAGCLKGIATGDAVGKQTELLSHAEVVRRYPQGIRGFEGRPGSIIPRYAGNRKREWRVGETTDDTERTIAVARAIIGDRGRVDLPRGFRPVTMDAVPPFASRP
jgi:ADP-ribosylglycohydrolase